MYIYALVQTWFSRAAVILSFWNLWIRLGQFAVTVQGL